VIGRATGHAGRIGLAVLVLVLVADGTGSAFLDRVSASGVLTGSIISPGEGDGRRHATATPSSAVTTSPVPATPYEDGRLVDINRVAPYLETVEPTTAGVPVNAAIVMTFSQPMNRMSVEMSFALQPMAEGHFTWRDDFTLRFAAFKLVHATLYQVEVRGRSLRGMRLSGARRWSFSTVSRAPDVLAPGPYAINLPILTYHYIRVNPDPYDRLGFALSVTPADFAAQMDWLARNGYHPISTEDLYAYLQHARGLPSKPVILTFDDGYADFFTTALPILLGHDFKAVAYVVSGFVGQPGYMTSDQIREADRSDIEIGSHTVSHANLATASAGNVQAQLMASKQFLEDVIGHPVVSFCYPSGKFTAAVASQVAAAGYHDATTIRFGYSHTLGDRYLWTRLRVSGGERLDQFAAAVLSAF
jgi:peptidoglycan/xylan/chitin deacetylase (PgdA/CDA1 family)